MNLNERGAYLTRILDDGRVIDVYPLALGRARIVVSVGIQEWTWTDGW